MIQTQQDILNEAVRRAILKSFRSAENKARKAEAYKRYDCLKDRSDKYVRELLLDQFDITTVKEMQYAVTNISFTRKIIDKLARVYSNGVKRLAVGEKEGVTDDEGTKQIEKAARLMKINKQMKKWNRFFKLFKNAACYVKPVKCLDGKWEIQVKILPPFLYDVIPNPENEEEGLVWVLSSYDPSNGGTHVAAGAPKEFVMGDAAYARREGKGGDSAPEVRSMGPLTASAVPIEKDAEEHERYIWWSPEFHFTTNGKGQLVQVGDQMDTRNPLQELPIINLAEDQDDCFWAIGGGDVSDSGIRINAMLTNVNHISVTQGYGQLFVTGKNVPKSFKVGPNHAITMETEAGEPNPTAEFLSANPPVADLLRTVEMYAALILSTNNLSTKSVKSSLNANSEFPSGIAMVLDMAESNEDVDEQAENFSDAEPIVWRKIAKWLEIYKSREHLSDKFRELELKPDLKMTVSFQTAKPIISEKEELEIIEKRKELGLNTQLELLMRDDPSLDEEGAKAKLKKILEEKMENQARAVEAGLPTGEGVKPGEGNQDGSNGNPDDGNAGPVRGPGAAGGGKGKDPA